MNERKAAAVTYFVVGGVALLRAVNALLKPEYSFMDAEHMLSPALHRWGGGASGLVFGAAMAVLGLVTLKATDPAEKTGALHFVNEAVIPLGPVGAGFLLLLAMASFTAVLPYTGERGVEPGQLAAVAFLFPMLCFGAWVFLHWRRLTLFDSSARRFVISWGKPWAALSRSFAYADFTRVSVQRVERARGGAVFRIMATGDAGQKLLTFTFAEESATACVAQIAKETGWRSA